MKSYKSLQNNTLTGSGRFALRSLYFCLFLLFPYAAQAQLSSGELYQQNTLGVSDSNTQRVYSQRVAQQTPGQPLEAPVNPTTYVLGPGDGLYLNVFSIHSLDQDLVVSPEGVLIIPRIGQLPVAGLTVSDAEAKVNTLLSKDYKTPNASLTLRTLRPIKISILGEVLVPGVVTATSLQRVSEVIDKSGGFKPSSSLRNIQIRNATGQIRATADLYKYFALGDLSANPVVESGDVIEVPQATKFVTVSGSVGSQGKMEFVPGDSLSTIIALAKGALPSAQLDSVEIARFPASDPSHMDRMYVRYTAGENIPLQDGDAIHVRSITQFHMPRMVSIGGEVRFPGRYAIDPGQTRILDVLNRAGGVLSDGSLDESVLIRRVGTGSYENDAELQRLQSIGALRKEGMSEAEYTYYVARLHQLNRSVMIVDFKSLVQLNDQSQNLLLREEDSIAVPRARGFVTVAGSVNAQGNIGYIENGTYADYIARAGGYTVGADREGVRVVNSKTNSYIDPRDQRDYQISPGDMIIVPQAHSEFWKDLGTVTALTAQILTIVAGIFLLVKK